MQQQRQQQLEKCKYNKNGFNYCVATDFNIEKEIAFPPRRMGQLIHVLMRATVFNSLRSLKQ